VIFEDTAEKFRRRKSVILRGVGKTGYNSLIPKGNF
jgi:hypothetical protein